MSYVLISVMLASILAGYCLRKYGFVRNCGRYAGYVIYVLLFLLGAAVGADRNITGAFVSVGMKALVMALAGSLGASLAAWGVYILFFRNEKEEDER